MSERLLITKVKKTSATQAELFGARHRYPDLKLFDIGELAAVGLDPAALPMGEEQPARFYALYELSEKLNKDGHPYKDVIALEPIGSPATAASVDNSALLAEVRAIRGVLEAMAAGAGRGPWVASSAPAGDQAGGEEGAADLDAAFPRYLDGAAVGDNPAELQAYNEYKAATGQAPADLAGLREWAKDHQKGKKG